MSKQKEYVWAIAYINIAQVPQLEKDLRKSNQFKGIEAYIPTVKVLKKQFKGKESFDEVPLLFNYGFFKIPYLWAMNFDMLQKLKEDFTCIAHWVKDPASIHCDVQCALAKEADIENIIAAAKANNIYAAEDIENLQPGNIITLQGYPFEGMKAEVVEIRKKSKKVLVKLDTGFGEDEDYTGRPVEVSFENVFYSIYKGSYGENYNQERSLQDYQSDKHSKLHNDEN